MLEVPAPPILIFEFVVPIDVVPFLIFGVEDIDCVPFPLCCVLFAMFVDAILPVSILLLLFSRVVFLLVVDTLFVVDVETLISWLPALVALPVAVDAAAVVDAPLPMLQ